MRPGLTCTSTVPLSLFALPLLAAATAASLLFAAPLAAQQATAPITTLPAPAQTSVSGTVTAVSATAPAAPSDTPAAPSPKADTMTPAALADVAARGIQASGMFTEKYTYTESEHMQNLIDGQLVVDHTTVFENIFIHNRPYMRKLSVDGKLLEGKDLKRETALYDDAVKQQTSLDRATRANLERHALRSTSHTDFDKLADNFQLTVAGHETVDGHDCVILDVMPKPGNADPALARHIRIDIDNSSLDVIDIHVEFLADDNGFSKGSVFVTHYTEIAGVPLETHHTEDTVVRFKELLDKPIHIRRDVTYSNYRRFRATVVIKMVSEAPAETTPEPSTPTDPRAAKKAKADADKKAKADAKKAREDAKRTPPPTPTFIPSPA